MTVVNVKASVSYEIRIGSGLLAAAGEQIRALGRASAVCLVSDSNVYPLHGAAVTESLERAGFRVVSFVFPAGEESKCPEVYLQLLNFMAEQHITRSDIVAALGGGVTGDLAGFAAATYQRGIRFVQLPTSLLAAVDSSVGGKTAIDLKAGKNMCGAFHQPSLVICDTDALSTLPREIFIDGCAEVIKYSVLYDRGFFDHLTGTGPDFDREYVIRRCVEMKRDVVAEDEFDNGARRKLNLGHTIGHAVEARSSFGLSHGKSVAIGLAAVCRAASARGLLDARDAEAVIRTLQAYGLPVQIPYQTEELMPFLLSDKKRSGGSIPFIIPREIGRCEILPLPAEEAERFVEDAR